MFTPNPTTQRAFRVKWSLKPNSQIIAYAAGTNLVIRDLADCRNSFIYNQQVINDITCVRYNHNGHYVAFGDAKGGLKVIGWSGAENNYIVKYENENMISGGAVHDIAWSEDNKKIIAVGSGNSRAKALDIDSGSGAGEVTGHTGTLLSVDTKIHRPFMAVVTGEDKEV